MVIDEDFDVCLTAHYFSCVAHLRTALADPLAQLINYHGELLELVLHEVYLLLVVLLHLVERQFIVRPNLFHPPVHLRNRVAILGISLLTGQLLEHDLRL